VEAKSDTSRFIYHHGAETAYLLLYVDDIVLTASNGSLLRRISASLQQEFAMKDLGALHHFLRVTVEPHLAGLLLHQRQYTLDILERARMTDYKPCSTPVDTQGKLSEAGGNPVTDPTAYRSLVGALQYLTFTQPHITYAVQQICLQMHDPGSHTSLLSSGSFGTSAALSTSASFTGGRPPPSSSSTLTPTGPGVQTLTAPPPATPSS